jgi:hypothetical protein
VHRLDLTSALGVYGMYDSEFFLMRLEKWRCGSKEWHYCRHNYYEQESACNMHGFGIHFHL